MAQLLAPAFGNGSDGTLTISSNTTDTPIDSSCSGTAGATSLTATNASFSPGQLILIHQTRGTGAGQWELNKIASYSAGTITTVLPLAYTYTDSGASQAQVLVVKQYSQITINSGKTLTAKAWNGNVGGILAYMCSGKITVVGTITAKGKGYRRGAGVVSAQTGYQGEGTAGTGSRTTSANATAGGGGAGSVEGGSGGGGGSHATVGTTGVKNPNTSAAGSGATTIPDTADLTTMVFGGGGGAGGADDSTGVGPDQAHGGAGGGIIFLCGATIQITGSIIAGGNNGIGAIGSAGCSGGGGAGGAVLIKVKTAILGAGLVTALAGNGGGRTYSGGNGGVGRIRVEACSLTGSTTPAASEVEGGQDYCGAVVSVIDG